MCIRDRASGVDIAEIGAVIVATSTADNAFPSTAAIVQKELGLAENVLAFDLSSACTCLLYTSRQHCHDKKYLSCSAVGTFRVAASYVLGT